MKKGYTQYVDNFVDNTLYMGNRHIYKPSKPYDKKTKLFRRKESFT